MFTLQSAEMVQLVVENCYFAGLSVDLVLRKSMLMQIQ